MKTYKHLYTQIHSFENLYRAFRAARKGKRERAAVAAFEFDLEGNLLQLQAELREQTYCRPKPCAFGGRIETPDRKRYDEGSNQ